MEIGNAWAENAFVVKGNLVHARAHDREQIRYIKGKNILNAVTVWNDDPRYNLFGVLDVLEITKNDDDIHYAIIEYKPTKPKNSAFYDDDALQVFAQKICVDYTFNCNCKAYIYYADVKKRIELPFSNEYEKYDDALVAALTQMRKNLKLGNIPQIQKGQKCSGCSMQDLCMPKLKKQKSIRDRIALLSAEEV